MTEERKHAILFATTLLSARKLIEIMESATGSHGPATEHMARQVRTDLARSSGLRSKKNSGRRSWQLTAGRIGSDDYFRPESSDPLGADDRRNPVAMCTSCTLEAVLARARKKRRSIPCKLAYREHPHSCLLEL